MSKADLVLYGSHIFAGIGLPEDHEFVAITGNRISKVGKREQMAECIGPDTTVLHIPENYLLMPGFIDSHTHIILAGMYQECVNLETATSEEESAQMVAEYAKDIPDDQWVIGFKWYHLYWDKKELPSKKTLDKYFPDRPVYLLNAEAHGAWVNSKALEIAGITKDTPDPPFGEIMRDESGEPTGYLYETAQGLVTSYAFAMPTELEKTYIMTYVDKANSYGITGMVDMLPYFGINLGGFETFHDLDLSGKLTVRVHAAADLCGDLDQIQKAKEKYHSEKYQISLLKQFVDGVSTTYTALLLEPYSDRPGDIGKSLIDIKKMNQCVKEAHRRGMSVRLHACADGSVRAALDAYADAIEAFGDTGARHAVEHCEVIHPNDIGRFESLGVIASFQPEHLAITDDFASNPYPDRFGHERCRLSWPIKSVLDSGATVCFGSDCPVVDNSPFLEIYRAVTRLYNDGEPKGGWNPQEIISVEEALHCYTKAAAYGIKREHEIGTVEEGKLADIIVVDRDLLSVTPDKIRDTKVVYTIMDGTIVYRSET